jgi:hypothetical protein
VCATWDGAPSSMRASLWSGGRDRDSSGSHPTRTRERCQTPDTSGKIDSLYFEHLHFQIYLCYLDELLLCLVDCSLQPSCENKMVWSD